MIIERHEAAMAIAIINKISKLVYDGIRLNSTDAVEYTLSDHPDFQEITKSIIKYIDGDKDKKLYDQLIYLVDSSLFSKFYKSLKDKKLKIELSNLMDCLDTLHEYAQQCTKEYYKDYPDLVNDIKLNRYMPLIIEIPDRHGTGRSPDFITSYIKEAIGLKL